jgi:hypothetical protein
MKDLTRHTLLAVVMVGASSCLALDPKPYALNPES